MSTDRSANINGSILRLISLRLYVSRFILWFQELTHDQRSIRIIRYAVGVSVSTALAFAIEWPLSFLTPVLTAVVLAMPLPALSLRGGLKNMLHTVSAFALGLVFTLFLLPYPLIYVPMLGLALFQIYYLLNRGGSFWLVLMSLLAILILPMLGNTSEGLVTGFVFGFVWSGWLTVVMIWLAHMLVPDPPGGKPFPKRPGFQAVYSQPAAQAALKSTIVVLPLATVFIVADLSGLLLVMVFAAIFSLSPDLGKGTEAGKNSLMSTVIGGMGAWVFYYLIVAVPQYHFYIALIFLTCLYFGNIIFSARPAAKYFGSAFVALFVLVNSSTGEDADFASLFMMRMLFIFLATLYVIAALKMLERYWPGRPQES